MAIKNLIMLILAILVGVLIIGIVIKLKSGAGL